VLSRLAEERHPLFASFGMLTHAVATAL